MVVGVSLRSEQKMEYDQIGDSTRTAICQLHNRLLSHAMALHSQTCHHQLAHVAHLLFLYQGSLLVACQKYLPRHELE